MIYQLIQDQTIIYSAKVDINEEIMVIPFNNGSLNLNLLNQQLFAIGIDVFFPEQNTMIDDRCPLIYQSLLFELLCISSCNKLIFEYFTYKYPLTIGKSARNDIVASVDEDGFLDNGKIALSNTLFVEGKKQNSYSFGQLIQLDKLMLIIHPNFIMVNQGKHLVNLEKYLPQKETISKCYYIEYQPPYLSNSVDYQFEYQLKNMPTYRIYEPSTLISTLGPGLTMASASLFLASFNIYSSYQSGKAIETLFPMLIFPMVMIISLVFWQPVIRHLEKRRCKHYNQAQYDEYMIYLDHLIQQINQNIIAFKKDVAIFEGDQPYCIQPYHRLFHSLYLGEYTNQEVLKFVRQSNNIHPMIDPEVDGIINEYITRRFPLLFDLRKDNRLAIVGHRSYLNYLLYQLVFSRNYSDLKCVFFGGNSNLESYFCTRHFYQDELYLQVTNLMTRQQILNSVKSTSVIAIIFDHHLFAGLEKDYSAIYYFDYLEHIKESFECVIDHNLVIIDKQIQLVCQIKKDYKSSFYELRQYKLKENSKLSSDIISFFDLNQLIMPIDQLIMSKWQKKKHGLEVLIGINEFQMPISLNLHEAYDGPHGLVAGTTGSGKTELLISLILGLCTNYTYKDVQLVLIDFKGVNLIECFRGFPHLVGEVSNIELSSLKRALLSLKSECIKRERAFESLSKLVKHSVGSFDSYIENYNSSYGLEYFARIVIVVDEFAELKRLSPEFIDELVSIARVGRSLGFHLIMATQKPSGVIDAQIWANMHYKICLRVQDKQDALDVIESTDSYYLRNPGAFYLKSNRIYLKAQATLATCSAQDYKFNNTVHLYKDQGISVESAKVIRPKTKNQLQVVKEAIQNIAKNEKAQVSQLWLTPLSPQYLSTYSRVELKSTHKITVGKSDNLQEATQKSKMIDLKQDCPLLIKTATTFCAHHLVQILIEACEEKQLMIYILDEVQQYHSFNHNNICFIDTKIDCNVDYFLRHVQTSSLVIANGVDFCLHHDWRWQKLISLALTSITLIVVDSKKQLSQQRVASFKKVWFNGLTRFEYDSGLKIDLKPWEIYDGQHVVCLFKPSNKKGKNLLSAQYLKRPVENKRLKNKWLIGYDVITLKPIYLSYLSALVVQGEHSNYFCIKMEAILALLPKTSPTSASLWIDDHFPPQPFLITSTKRRENEALLYYENKTHLIYLAYE